MSETPDAPRLAETFDEVEDALLSRWPETKLEPSLDRIRAFTELLGDPQRAYPVIHLTGTNGKTSTSRMIDTLLRALDLRTGRFTSPHVERMTERISVDGEPLTDEEFVRAFNDVAPYTRPRRRATRTTRCRSSRPSSAMAYAAFADAPGRRRRRRGRHGRLVGRHQRRRRRGRRGAADRGRPRALPRRHARRDRRREGRDHQARLDRRCSPSRPPTSPRCCWSGSPRSARPSVREGIDFGVAARTPAVGGQMLSLQGLRGAVRRRVPPALRRPPGAERRRRAGRGRGVPRRRATPLDADLVRAAFAEVTSPGRLEIVRRSPTVVLDAAHNPHGAEALGAALEDSFTFNPLIGVVGVMADKDHEGLLAALRAAPGPRRLHPELHRPGDARRAAGRRRPRGLRRGPGLGHAELGDAIEAAATLAEAGAAFGDGLGSGAVLVTGSVVTVGEARSLLVRRR